MNNTQRKVSIGASTEITPLTHEKHGEQNIYLMRRWLLDRGFPEKSVSCVFDMNRYYRVIISDGARDLIDDDVKYEIMQRGFILTIHQRPPTTKK